MSICHLPTVCSPYFSFIYILYKPIYHIHYPTRPNRRRPCRRRTHGSPPPPFSVFLQDANFANASATLSAVLIDTTSCPPLVQAIYKSVRFTKDNNILLHHQSKVFKLKGVFKYILSPSYYSTAHLPSTRCQALIMQS